MTLVTFRISSLWLSLLSGSGSGVVPFGEQKTLYKVGATELFLRKKDVNRPCSIYQYSNMAPRVLAQNCNLFVFFCLSITKRDFNTKKTTPNIEVCPESLGAMLEY